MFAFDALASCKNGEKWKGATNLIYYATGTNKTPNPQNYEMAYLCGSHKEVEYCKTGHTINVFKNNTIMRSYKCIEGKGWVGQQTYPVPMSDERIDITVEIEDAKVESPVESEKNKTCSEEYPNIPHISNWNDKKACNLKQDAAFCLGNDYNVLSEAAFLNLRGNGGICSTVSAPKVVSAASRTINGRTLKDGERACLKVDNRFVTDSTGKAYKFVNLNSWWMSAGSISDASFAGLLVDDINCNQLAVPNAPLPAVPDQPTQGTNTDESQKQAIIAAYAKLDDRGFSLKEHLTNAEGTGANWKRIGIDAGVGVAVGAGAGVLTNVLVKKNQLKKGYEAVQCVLPSGDIVNWGEEFIVQ